MTFVYIPASNPTCNLFHKKRGADPKSGPLQNIYLWKLMVVRAAQGAVEHLGEFAAGGRLIG